MFCGFFNKIFSCKYKYGPVIFQQSLNSEKKIDVDIKLPHEWVPGISNLKLPNHLLITESPNGNNDIKATVLVCTWYTVNICHVALERALERGSIMGLCSGKSVPFGGVTSFLQLHFLLR